MLAGARAVDCEQASGEIKFTPAKEDKMVDNRRDNLLLALAIVVMALFVVGAAISTQRIPQGMEKNQTAALDWYLAHDHAILDGDNNVLSK